MLEAQELNTVTNDRIVDMALGLAGQKFLPFIPKHFFHTQVMLDQYDLEFREKYNNLILWTLANTTGRVGFSFISANSILVGGKIDFGFEEEDDLIIFKLAHT